MQGLNALIRFLEDIDLLTAVGVFFVATLCIWIYLWSKGQKNNNPKQVKLRTKVDLTFISISYFVGQINSPSSICIDVVLLAKYFDYEFALHGLLGVNLGGALPSLATSHSSYKNQTMWRNRVEALVNISASIPKLQL